MIIKNTNKPRILVLDIETKPIAAYTWGHWDQNISAAQIIERGGTLCVGAKFVGDRKTVLLSVWEHGHEKMLAEIHAMMSEADAIVSYNGDRFDLPVLAGEYVLAGMLPPPPVPSIDLYRTVKGFRLGIHKLGYVGPLLEIGAKVKHEGFELWSLVMAGDAQAQRRMARYCKQDVVLTEKLYSRILPFIKNHPHLQAVPDTCPACGSRNLHKRGWYSTRVFRTQRLNCQDCGHWHKGKREKLVG